MSGLVWHVLRGNLMPRRLSKASSRAFYVSSVIFDVLKNAPNIPTVSSCTVLWRMIQHLAKVLFQIRLWWKNKNIIKKKYIFFFAYTLSYTIFMVYHDTEEKVFHTGDSVSTNQDMCIQILRRSTHSCFSHEMQKKSSLLVFGELLCKEEKVQWWDRRRAYDNQKKKKKESLYI